MSRLFRPLALLLALFLAGAGGAWWYVATHPGSSRREVTCYYLDPQGMYLVPVSRTLTLPGRSEAAVATVLSEVINHVPPGLAAPVPSGSVATVGGVRDGVARVVVRVHGLAPGSGGEQLLASAVVKSAASVPSVKEVALALQTDRGTPLESEHLDLSQPLSPTDPGMENIFLGGEGQGLAVTLYFRLPGQDYLVPLRVPLPPQYASEPLEGSLALLLAGPPPSLRGVLAPSVDPATDLRWNGLEDRTARLLWKNAPEATPSALALRALVLTLTESERLQAVRIVREGPPLAGRVGPFDLSAPLPRPEAVNSAIAHP